MCFACFCCIVLVFLDAPGALRASSYSFMLVRSNWRMLGEAGGSPRFEHVCWTDVNNNENYVIAHGVGEPPVTGVRSEDLGDSGGGEISDRIVLESTVLQQTVNA